jgi:hypothetical protein
VLAICEALLADDRRARDDRYWILATLWEAAVGLGNHEAAAKWRVEAEGAAAAAWMLESTRAQLAALAPLLAASPLTALQGPG